MQVEGEKVQLSRDELTQIMVGWAALQQPAAPPVGVTTYDDSDPDQKDFALVMVEDEVALKRMMREIFTHTRFGFDVETARAEGLSDEEEERLKTALDPYRARLRLVQIAIPGTVYVVDVWKTGQDLEWLKRDYVPRAEYDKLVASHKNLAKVVVGLQTEVRATKPQPAGGESQPPVPEPAAAAQSTEAAGSAAAPAAESAADAPAATVPQEDVEAVMDAAIMAAAGAAGTAGPEAPATPAFASPTGGARRRRS